MLPNNTHDSDGNSSSFGTAHSAMAPDTAPHSTLRIHFSKQPARPIFNLNSNFLCPTRHPLSSVRPVSQSEATDATPSRRIRLPTTNLESLPDASPSILTLLALKSSHSQQNIISHSSLISSHLSEVIDSSKEHQSRNYQSNYAKKHENHLLDSKSSSSRLDESAPMTIPSLHPISLTASKPYHPLVLKLAEQASQTSTTSRDTFHSNSCRKEKRLESTHTVSNPDKYKYRHEEKSQRQSHSTQYHHSSSRTGENHYQQRHRSRHDHHDKTTQITNARYDSSKKVTEARSHVDSSNSKSHDDQDILPFNVTHHGQSHHIPSHSPTSKIDSSIRSPITHADSLHALHGSKSSPNTSTNQLQSLLALQSSSKDNNGEINDADVAVPSSENPPDAALSSPFLINTFGLQSVQNFSIIKSVSEGAYGIVYKARSHITHDLVALKYVKIDPVKVLDNGFPLSSLREISALSKFKHPNIVKLRQVVANARGTKFYLVLDYVDYDLSYLLNRIRHRFSLAEIKHLIQQLLEAILYLHSSSFTHRDIKSSNLLISKDGHLYLADFGHTKEYFVQGGAPLTPNVVTIGYRAPELVFGAKGYTPAIDIWSIGCVMAELLLGRPLLDVKTEVEQVVRMAEIFGSPTVQNFGKGVSELRLLKQINVKLQPNNYLRKYFSNADKETFSLLSRLLCYNPKERITASEALADDWFKRQPLGIPPCLEGLFIPTSGEHIFSPQSDTHNNATNLALESPRSQDVKREPDVRKRPKPLGADHDHTIQMAINDQVFSSHYHSNQGKSLEITRTTKSRDKMDDDLSHLALLRDCILNDTKQPCNLEFDPFKSTNSSHRSGPSSSHEHPTRTTYRNPSSSPIRNSTNPRFHNYDDEDYHCHNRGFHHSNRRHDQLSRHDRDTHCFSSDYRSDHFDPYSRSPSYSPSPSSHRIIRHHSSRDTNTKSHQRGSHYSSVTDCDSSPRPTIDRNRNSKQSHDKHNHYEDHHHYKSSSHPS